MEAQIAASLRHLKEAAVRLADAAHAIGDADPTATTNIVRVLQLLSAEITRLHQQSTTLQD